MLSLRSWVLGITSNIIIIIGLVSAILSIIIYFKRDKTERKGFIFSGFFLLSIFFLWLDSTVEFWSLLLFQVHIHPYLSQQLDAIFIAVAGLLWTILFYYILQDKWLFKRFLPYFSAAIGGGLIILMFVFPNQAFFVLPPDPTELTISNFTLPTLVMVLIYIIVFFLTSFLFYYASSKTKEKSLKMKYIFLALGINLFCIGVIFLSATTGIIVITIIAQVLVMISAVLLFLGFNAPKRWFDQEN